MEGQRRKSETLGGLGRAFSRLRATIKRRGSGRDGAGLEGTATARNEPTKPDEQTGVTGVAGGNDTEAVEAPSAATSNVLGLSALDAEGAIDVDELDQPTQVTGIERGTGEEQRAREFFSKHGLHYQTRSQRAESSSSPAKGKRVEKPVRMRVHWKCHQCQGSFSRDKMCLGCAHRRCEDCIRLPPRKLRETTVRTPQELEQSSHAAKDIAKAPVLDEPVSSSGVLAKSPDAGALGLLGLTSEPPLADQTETEDEADANYAFGSFWVRPRTSEMLIVQAKRQIVRRQCHQCETLFLPASRTECRGCQHIRCSLCPRWLQGTSGDEWVPFEEAPMVRAVQRVYKKPRQRVRWTCDQCQAVFIQRRICSRCGHDRCETCTRYPPKRENVPDQAIVQAVIERLAAYHLASEPQRTGLIAAA